MAAYGASGSEWHSGTAALPGGRPRQPHGVSAALEHECMSAHLLSLAAQSLSKAARGTAAARGGHPGVTSFQTTSVRVIRELF